MTKDELVVLVIQALPYSEQMKELDTSDPTSIVFKWRNQKFRVSTGMAVSTVEGALQIGGDVAILFEALLKRTYTETQLKCPSPTKS